MNKTHFVLGGDLQKSLTEGYTLDFKTLFKDSFAVTRKNFVPLIFASLVTVSIVALFYIFTFDALATLSETNQTLVNFFFSSFIITPLVAGLQMMGVHHSVGIKSRAPDLFNFFRMIMPLALSSMLINVLVFAVSLAFTAVLGDIGLQLSIIVMLYLNMTFCMVYPLIAEKKLSAQIALKLSFRLVNKNLMQFTCLFLLLGLLAILALLPSGLGMFLFIPFYFNLMGIVYRQMCGVGVVATDVSDEDNDSSNGGSPNENSSNSQSSNGNPSKNSSEFEA